MIRRSLFRAALALLGFASGVLSNSAHAAGIAALKESIGVDRGICVVTGPAARSVAIGLATHSQLTVVALVENATELARMREAADKAGLLGTRLYVERWSSKRVPLADSIADAVVVTTGGTADRNELLRVVHPGGKIIVGGKITVRPVQKGADAWSHPYHGPDNNPQSSDKLARGPFLTRFLATPYYGPMPEVTVSAGGRLFKAFGHIAYKRREWPMLGKLIAMNGYNGTVLWERRLAPGFMIHRNTIVATPKTLYLADNESCKLIDAATGKLRDEIRISKSQAAGPGWKWMAVKKGVLYALVGKKDLIDKVLRGDRKKSGWPWSGMGAAYARKVYPWGFGKTLLAIDLKTRKTLWTHRSREAIDSRALCMNGSSIFLYSDKKFLKAIEAKTGKLRWTTSATDVLNAIGTHRRAQNPREGYASTVYVKCNDQALYFAGPQRSKLVAVSAKDGTLLWQHDHGNFQLLLRGGAVYAMGRTETSKKFDGLTGKVLGDLECFRGNCTRATGTVDSIFARGYRHTGTMQFSTEKNKQRRLPAMRPACQDGVIVANGLLYWGPWMCDCNHSLVGVISLGPAGAFNFSKPATDQERLQRAPAASASVVAVQATASDWPAYRRNNQRTAQTPVAIPDEVKLRWTYQPNKPVTPTAPVSVGQTMFVAGSDGIVRAIDSRHGTVKWSAYTSGPVKYPPTIWNGRVFVGSADGYVYSFSATDGRLLWRFRAAPIDRRIPVYGTLSSTWPVASGVLVENGTAYAAAGIVSHDGTHVYALDALTGKLKWQNNTSGRLMKGDAVAGVSVQGHLLLNNGTLYMAGGNVVSPARYDAKTGACLNQLTNEWQKAPRGSELFLAAGKVRVIDRMMYSPREYIPSRYYGKYLVEASSGKMVIQGTESAMMRVALSSGKDAKPRLIWQNDRFLETAGVVLCKNCVLAVGRLKPKTKNGEPENVLAAIDPTDGSLKWRQPLPAPSRSWGIAVDRDGRILVTLIDGRVLGFSR